jgi:hypothetical protein
MMSDAAALTKHGFRLAPREFASAAPTRRCCLLGANEFTASQAGSLFVRHVRFREADGPGKKLQEALTP